MTRATVREISTHLDRATGATGEDKGKTVMAMPGSVSQLVSPHHQRVVEKRPVTFRNRVEQLEKMNDSSGSRSMSAVTVRRYSTDVRRERGEASTWGTAQELSDAVRSFGRPAPAPSFSVLTSTP